MNKQRIKKIESVVFDIAGTFLIEEIREVEADYGLINITGVKLSSDTSYLDINVSSLKNKETLCKTLAEHAKELQRVISKKLTLRVVPRVRFRYDESGEIAQDVTFAINNLD